MLNSWLLRLGATIAKPKPVARKKSSAGGGGNAFARPIPGPSSRSGGSAGGGGNAYARPRTSSGGGTTSSGGSWGGGGGGYGYSYGGGGGGGGGVARTAAPAKPKTPPRLSDKDWLKKDTSYQAMLKSLSNRLNTFRTENSAQRSRGIQDYHAGLGRLGWDRENKTWMQDDQTTAYGNAINAMMNDFASRGTLQSTLYDQANTDLQTSFGRQRDEMGTAHTSFLEELQRALKAQETETQQSRDQARMEALARRAAQESK